MSCDVQLAEMPCSLCLFHFLLTEVLSMATATTPVGQDQPSKARPPVVFDLSQAPVIEGFTPLPRAKEENFKDKFIRKTKENPFVPIGELHKTVNSDLRKLQNIIMIHQNTASYDFGWQQLNAVEEKMQRFLNRFNVALFVKCHCMETSSVMYFRSRLSSCNIYGMFH